MIANAGVAFGFDTVATTSPAVVEEHIAVNAVAPVLLFQAVLPLLEAASKPQFIILGSGLGSIGDMEQQPKVPAFAYGASKAVAHFTSRKIHFTHENIISYILDPG